MSRAASTAGKPRWVLRALVAAGAIAGLYALGLGVQAGLMEYVQRIMLIAGINVILAVGLNLINGTTGQFSIGHAGFMAVGAYATAFVSVQLAPHVAGLFGAGSVADAVTFNLALLVGAVLAGLAGVVVGLPSLRLKGDYLAIVTLGFGEIIRIVFNNAQFLGAATGYFGDSAAGLPTYTSFFWVFFWVMVVITLIRNVTFSQTGRSLVAIREDEVAAEAMATPTTRLKVLAFTLSAATAGIAGGLFAHMQAGIRPEDFKFDKSIDMIVMIIVGGLGSISGAALGGIFVAVTLELMRDLQQYRLVLYALLLILIMLVRPEGLLGQRELGFGWLTRRTRRAGGELTLLTLERVDKVFGGLRAVREVSFGVEPKAIFGLIGPNGAGKTTIFNVVTGVYRPDGGRVLLEGKDVSRLGPTRIATLGVARTFQNIRLFRAMTVEENVMVAGHKLHKAGLLSAIVRDRAHAEDERALTARARELLDVLGLAAQAEHVAGSLPYGSQRRLEIARALMLAPKILLLDEPAAGMNTSEAGDLERQIRFLRDELGVTIVLVEHNMSVVMSVCDRIHVVDHGETIAEGTPAEIKAHPRVLAAYLGQEDEPVESTGASA